MAGKKIFVSYRRQDAGGEAGRLSDVLQEAFKHDRVFMDVDTIEPGSDFVDVINNAVSSCDVMLVMIGPHWTMIKDASGKRRLDNPDDFVRLEIGVALKRNIRVIPVLVNGATMPTADQLPDDLDGITRRHAHELSSSRWKYDSDQLIILLEKLLLLKRIDKDEEDQKKIFVKKDKEKSWWAKYYLWVIGVSLVAIVLLNIPPADPYAENIEDTTYPELEDLHMEDADDNPPQPSTIDEWSYSNNNRPVNSNANLTGRWSGINAAGEGYYFDMTQNGNFIIYTEYSYSGNLTASGSGKIVNRDIALSYYYPALDMHAEIQLTLTNDGQKLNGTFVLPVSGTSYPISLTKNY